MVKRRAYFHDLGRIDLQDDGVMQAPERLAVANGLVDASRQGLVEMTRGWILVILPRACRRHNSIIERINNVDIAVEMEL